MAGLGLIGRVGLGDFFFFYIFFYFMFFFTFFFFFGEMRKDEEDKFPVVIATESVHRKCVCLCVTV